MNGLTTERRVQVVRAICEGNSIRSTSRMTGVAINTVVKLLIDLGSACLDYQDVVMRNLPCKRPQSDEVWSFVFAKAKNVPEQYKGKKGYGDVWTRTALDAAAKPVPCWQVGNRTGEDAKLFNADLASRLAGRVQLTSDGHRSYLEAVEGTFGLQIDCAQFVKLYGP